MALFHTYFNKHSLLYLFFVIQYLWSVYIHNSNNVFLLYSQNIIKYHCILILKFYNQFTNNNRYSTYVIQYVIYELKLNFYLAILCIDFYSIYVFWHTVVVIALSYHYCCFHGHEWILKYNFFNFIVKITELYISLFMQPSVWVIQLFLVRMRTFYISSSIFSWFCKSNIIWNLNEMQSQEFT